MKSSDRRRIDRSLGALPPKGTKEYNEIAKFYENNSLVDKATLNKYYNKVLNSLEAQIESNCGSLTELNLRWFQNEFTSRAINHGLHSMPLAFNLMEAFFEFRKPEIYYELLEEENYELSFFEFLEFVLEKNLDFTKESFENMYPNNLILNFNINEYQEDIYFSSSLNEKYKILGASTVRRDSEITLTLILGKILTDVKENTFSVEKNSIKESLNGKKEIVESYLQKIKDKKEILPTTISEGEDNIFQKCVFGIRYDIDTLNIDFQYLLEEYDDFFKVSTDNLVGLYDFNKSDFISDSIKSAFDTMQSRLNEIIELFEVVKLCLFLPKFLNENDEKISDRDVPTKLKEKLRSPIYSRKFKDVYGNPQRQKPLYSLFLNNVEKELLEIDDKYFNLQRSGYWKELEKDEIGKNKKGDEVLGKTWVNKMETYYRKDDKRKISVIQKKRKFNDPNSGYIYITRNPLQPKDIFKIGLTTTSPEQRMSQLTNTSNADKFYIYATWETKDCKEAEKKIHEALVNSRVDMKREFFLIEDMRELTDLIQTIIDEVNA